jgi:solute carrier family 25 carnitine/acylcarnitine transporter 20/29
MQRKVADREFKGTFDCVKKIVRQQGLFGLWSGLSGSLLFRANFFFMFLSIEAGLLCLLVALN